MSLSDILRKIRQIFVRLTGDEEAAIGKKISARFPGWLPLLSIVSSQLVDEKWHPACRSLDETKPQTRKHFGDLIQHKIAESVQRRETRMGPLPVPFQVEHCCYRWRSGTGVNADGQINVHRRLVHREEIGIV